MRGGGGVSKVLHCFVQRWFAAATAQKIMYRLQWSKKAPD